MRTLSGALCIPLTIFTPATTYVLCHLILFIFLVSYIANNMDLDQFAPKGAVWSAFLVFASMIKSIPYKKKKSSS